MTGASGRVVVVTRAGALERMLPRACPVVGP